MNYGRITVIVALVIVIGLVLFNQPAPVLTDAYVPADVVTVVSTEVKPTESVSVAELIRLSVATDKPIGISLSQKSVQYWLAKRGRGWYHSQRYIPDPWGWRHTIGHLELTSDNTIKAYPQPSGRAWLLVTILGLIVLELIWDHYRRRIE